MRRQLEQLAAASQALQDAKVKHDALARDRLDQGAIQRDGNIVGRAAPDLPVVNVLAIAVQAIGPVLSGSIPPLALITTLIGIGSKLGAAAYDHWIARISDLPYTPGQFSSKLLDGNAAISVITQVPTLFNAFGPQLASGDRATAVDVVQLALAADGSEALLNKYPQAFDGLAQPSIESAVRDLRKAALDFVLGQEVLPDAAKDVGGLASLLKAVDQVRTNHEASAALELVMTTAKTLKSSQLDPELVFTNAASLLAHSNMDAASGFGQAKLQRARCPSPQAARPFLKGAARTM
jgi:hypothetical protein